MSLKKMIQNIMGSARSVSQKQADITAKQEELAAQQEELQTASDDLKAQEEAAPTPPPVPAGSTGPDTKEPEASPSGKNWT